MLRRARRSYTVVAAPLAVGNMVVGGSSISDGPSRTEMLPGDVRAFDVPTGAVIHEVELPARPGGTPMTYMLDGKQYIAMAAGGSEVRMLALSLP